MSEIFDAHREPQSYWPAGHAACYSSASDCALLGRLLGLLLGLQSASCDDAAGMQGPARLHGRTFLRRPDFAVLHHIVRSGPNTVSPRQTQSRLPRDACGNVMPGRGSPMPGTDTAEEVVGSVLDEMSAAEAFTPKPHHSWLWRRYGPTIDNRTVRVHVEAMVEAIDQACMKSSGLAWVELSRSTSPLPASGLRLLQAPGAALAVAGGG